MEPGMAASYRAAAEVARTQARNFYYSFVVLPPEKRRALCAVYAFMRYCDDISDGDGTAESKKAGLVRWRAQLDSALTGQTGSNPIFPAFSDTVRRFRIPGDYFHWIIDGAEMDLTLDRYETFDDLYHYCFRVASAVGLVCVRIFGYSDERAIKLAEECGIAFQLTNILRDIKEDAAMGRIYIPADELRRFNCDPADFKNGTLSEDFRRLMSFQIERAQHYYEKAGHLLPLVDKPSRPSLWAMVKIYRGILEKIEKRRCDVFKERIRLSNSEKSVIMLRALAMRFVPGAAADRLD